MRKKKEKKTTKANILKIDMRCAVFRGWGRRGARINNKL